MSVTVAPLTLAPLPPVRTALLGRAREAESLSGFLTDSATRLLTMVGPGGVGKTRLALHVARDVSDVFDGNVAFVSLAPIREPRLVLLAIGQAVGLSMDPDETYQQHLVDAMRGQRMLLVLDNLEQVLGVAASLDELLAFCPELTILATSQVALGLPYEQVFPLLPLPTLDPATTPAGQLIDQDAFALFVERARAVDPAFTAPAGSEEARAVAAICHHLDGLPLAIELAAARANIMSPQTVLDRLGRRLSALGEYRGEVPNRLRTMRAAIGWSYDLLDPAGQALFRRLSVFAGGFPVAAAGSLDPGHGRTLLETLIARSLVLPMPTVQGEPRAMMLQTLADYGLEQLAAHGEEDAARLAHASYIAQLTEEAEPHLTGADQAAWMERLDAESENLRAAMEWALAHDREDIALRIGGATWRYLGTRGLFTDGRRWLERALAARRPELMPYRVKALIGAGYLAEDHRDLEAAQAWFEQAQHLAMAVGDSRAESQALIGLGTVAHDQGDYDVAFGLHQRATELARAAGDQRGIAIGYGNLGAVAYFQGRLEDALKHFSEGQKIMEALGDKTAMAIAAGNMGALALELGDLPLAEGYVRQALCLQRELNARRDLPTTLINLGEVTREQGKLDAAEAAFSEAIALMRENHDVSNEGIAMHGYAELALVQGNMAAAASRVLRSIELLTGYHDPHSMLENAQFVARLAIARGDHAKAVELLSADHHIREQMGIEMSGVMATQIAQMVSEARDALEPDDFTTHWASGAEMDMDALTSAARIAARVMVGRRHMDVSVPVVEPEPIPKAPDVPLTAREVEILQLLAASKSTTEISEDLFVSARTVTTHITHILDKLGVPNRTAAVAYAMRVGLA